jgi:hypothetical protein
LAFILLCTGVQVICLPCMQPRMPSRVRNRPELLLNSRPLLFHFGPFSNSAQQNLRSFTYEYLV